MVGDGTDWTQYRASNSRYRDKFDLIAILHGFGPFYKHKNFTWMCQMLKLGKTIT